MEQLIVKRIPYPSGRIIAVGDVHGCLDELKRAIESIDIKAADTIVFLGDLMDRGPDSEGVIQFVRALSTYCNAYCVMGNHDEKHIRYRRHEAKKESNPNYKNPMKTSEVFIKTNNSLSSSSISYLASSPHAVFIDAPTPLCFVHAGITPREFNQNPKAFVRNRYFWVNQASGALISAKCYIENGEYFQPEGSEIWTKYWHGRWTVVYGHSVCEYPRVENNTFGIDCGCVFGYNLAMWIKAPDRPPLIMLTKSNFKFEGVIE